MEADEDACLVDVRDDVVEAGVVAGRVGDAAVERERDVVGAEERVQRRDHRGAVAGVRGRVLGEVRRRPSGCQVGSATVAGLPSVSACGIAW